MKPSWWKKSKGKTPKAKAWDAASKYGRLRDAIEYCKAHGISLRQFARPENIIGKCRTCPQTNAWIRMDCGHWKSRGIGGSSGIYFDERAFGLQCGQCNAFKQGAPKEYNQFMLEKYGQKVIDELEIKHHQHADFSDFAMAATEQFYKDEYNKLLVENGLVKNR